MYSVALGSEVQEKGRKSTDSGLQECKLTGASVVAGALHDLYLDQALSGRPAGLIWHLQTSVLQYLSMWLSDYEPCRSSTT